MTTAHQTALQSRTDLHRYSHNALILFALELRFQLEDIHTIAVDALTDGVDDKKCDLVYVDADSGVVVIAQGYMAQDTTRREAPANKATDLNTAVAWLLGRPINELPARLQPAAQELKNAIATNQVRSFHMWYVHNLPRSRNVQEEIRTVENTARSLLQSNHPNSGIQEVEALEVSVEILEEWYQSLQTPILVTGEFQLAIPGGYVISGDNWESFVTAVPASWVHQVFQLHKDKLFSANVRGYLGSMQSAVNINNGIKSTASTTPGKFWVYNNGLTALVHDFHYEPASTSSNNFKITGLSIVNGAQTTGAIGNLELAPAETAMVQARFVKCNDRETIQRIIEYNNRQNQVEASDFRSNDGVQRRLRDEFVLIPDVVYTGGRRGGHNDIIRRTANLVPSDTVAQALAAFHQDPVIAYNQKSQIWVSDTLYSRYFSEQTHAEHIIFTYSLLRSVENKKLDLVRLQNTNTELTQAQESQLTFLRNRGATFLLTSAVAKCLETFMGRAVPNVFRASFGPGVSPEAARQLWNPIVESTISFCDYLRPAVRTGLQNNDEALQAINTFRNLVEATRTPNTATYQQFANHVVLQ